MANIELEKLNEIKHKKIFYCINCGKEISRGSSLCLECYKEVRKEGRPEREELKNLIRSLPFTEIAKQYFVTDNAIRKWCDGYNLPRTKKEIKSFTDEEWIDV